MGTFTAIDFFFPIGKIVCGTSKIFFKCVCIDIGENSKIKLSCLNKYVQLKSQVFVCEYVNSWGGITPHGTEMTEIIEKEVKATNK